MSESAQLMTDDAVVALVREAIDNSREDVQRRAVDSTTPPSGDVQPPTGITIDLGHRNIQRLPDEVIDIIKDEIERYAIPCPLAFARLPAARRLPAGSGYALPSMPTS